MYNAIQKPAARLLGCLLIAAGGVGACQGRSDAGGETAANVEADPPSAATSTGKPDADSSGLGSTQRSDSAFLTMMSDHHQGLIDMATQATKRGSGATLQKDAERLQTLQKNEQQQMLQHLQTSFSATHSPMVMPQNQLMIDSLELLKGDAYRHGFYAKVVAHHEEGIGMIDSALPTLTDHQLKAMAEKMKAQQAKEIPEFRQKAGS